MRCLLPLVGLPLLLGDCVCDPLAADGDEGEGEAGEGEGEAGEGEGEGLAPPLCLDGWCWENPRPFAFDIEGVWPIRPDDVWIAVGGGDLLHWDGNRFEPGHSLVGASPFIAPTSLFGTSPTSLWAAAGGLFHFDGAAWSPFDTTALPQGTFIADVFGMADDDLWVIGNPALVAHWDGAAWTDHTPAGIAQGALLFSGQALTTDDAWVVGNIDTVLHWDGAAWSPRPVGDPSAILEGVWMSANDDVWAAGRTPTAIFHWDGTSWSPTPAPNARPVAHFWGATPDDIWGGGLNGVLHHWDGDLWTPVNFLSLPTPRLHAVRGLSSDDIWTVGDGGLIARFDGTAWTRPGQGEALQGFFVDVAGAVVDGVPHVAACGRGPLGGDAIVHRSAAGAWSVDQGTPNFMEQATAVAVTGPDDIWLSTRDDLLHFDGAAWSPVAMPEDLGPAHDLCALAEDDAWGLFAVDANNFDPGVVIARWDGTAWTVDARFDDVSANPGDELQRARLFCLDDGSLWAGGPDTLLRRDAGGWLRDAEPGAPEPTLAHPIRIQQVGDAIMAVDVLGRLWTRGETWTTSFVPPGDPVRQVSAAVLLSATEAFLLDDNGVLRHLAGGEATQVQTPFFFNLQAIERVGDDVFVVGPFGAVLRRER